MGNGLPKENKKQQNMLRTQCRESVHSKLPAYTQKAKSDKKMRFTTLMHHIYNIDMLRTAILNLKRNAAPGIDRETWDSYGENLRRIFKIFQRDLKVGI